MRLYLVRHPPPLVAPGICYGSTDLAVAPQETGDAAARLRPLLPAGAAVLSSPLRRCATLAAALNGDAVDYDGRLAEMHFGTWEMRSWDRIARAEIDAWCADPLGYRPGGGESVLEMALRVTAFRTELAARGLAHAVVICHAGTIRMLQAGVDADGPEDMAERAFRLRTAPACGALQVLDFH